MGIISAINWLVTKDNGWLLFPWSGCNGHNLSSFCPARHSWLSIGGEHLVCSGNNLSSAVQWSNSWLCIDTIRHQSVAGPVQQEVTCGEKQIKASDYNSSYLVGFQSVSTEVFSSRSSQGQAGFHWVEPEIVAVIVFNQSSLLTPTIIVLIGNQATLLKSTAIVGWETKWTVSDNSLGQQTEYSISGTGPYWDIFQ